MTIGNLSATFSKSSLTRDGKKLYADTMIDRGLGFIGAGLLLQQQNGNAYVVRHLYCQGIEVVLKGVLLLHDFDTYEPLLPRRKHFGHDLEKLIEECISCYRNRSRPLSKKTRYQLHQLTIWYSQNHLRYSSMLGILIDGDTIDYQRVMRCMKLVVQKIKARSSSEGA